jgi:hypothetical protein
LSSFRFCTIEFENPESALAAKEDLDKNPDIRVSLRRAVPVTMKRDRWKKLEENIETSNEVVYNESSLFVSYPNQERPPLDVIRKLHPKIIDVRVLRSKRAK